MSVRANPAPKGILFDCTLCIGCGACALACKQANGLPVDSADPRDDSGREPGKAGLSASAYTCVVRRGGRFVRKLCLHCEVPTCASVCPVGAIEKTEAGPVLYHEDRCIGCRYCMQACPMGVPKYEWQSLAPAIRKCNLCAERVSSGLPTACSQVCPTGATKFGTRDELIEEAKARIRARPDRYAAGLFGETDLGGTSVLFISDVPFESLGLPVELGKEPVPRLTLAVLRKLPTAVVVGALFLSGVWWITNRREEVEEWKERTGERH